MWGRCNTTRGADVTPVVPLLQAKNARNFSSIAYIGVVSPGYHLVYASLSGARTAVLPNTFEPAGSTNKAPSDHNVR
jgi:hypothetical protein